MVFAFYDRMGVFDHINKTVLVVAHARGDAEDPEAQYRRACARVDETCTLLASTRDELQLADFDSDRAGDRETVSNFSQESFEAAVTACKEYIRAGDIFQVVLSQRLQLETVSHASSIPWPRPTRGPGAATTPWARQPAPSTRRWGI